MKLFQAINQFATLFETVTGRTSRTRSTGAGKRKKPETVREVWELSQGGEGPPKDHFQGTECFGSVTVPP